MFHRREKMKPVSIITDSAVKQYMDCCNYHKDTKDEAILKIERDYLLGRIVSRQKGNEDNMLVQYFNIFIKVDNTIITSVFRRPSLLRKLNKTLGEFQLDEAKYARFNKKHGLVSERMERRRIENCR